MDKTLMRPLFKQKAEQLRKVDSKKVPGYVIGGLIPLGAAAMGAIRTAAAPTFRYLAPKVSSFLARPGVQTGLTGLEAYGVGVGTKEAAEGIVEGDVGKVLTGASLAVPGAAFIPTTARRSGIAAVRKAGEKIGDPSTKIGQAIVKNPGKTALGSIGLGGLGMFMSPEAQAQLTPPSGVSKEQYFKDVQDRLIYQKPVEADYLMGAKPADSSETEAEALTRISKQKPEDPAVVGLKDPKTKGEQTLNKQLRDIQSINSVAKKLGIEDAKTATDKEIKQIAIESNVPEQTLRQYIGKPKGTGQPTPTNPVVETNQNTANIPNYGPGEVNALKNERSKTLANAKAAQGTSTLANEFSQFKEMLAGITGDSNDNLNNLVMMKAASKLLTGKTRETGVRGLFDVGGQAMGASADMLFQLALAQKNQDMQLAQAFLKYKAAKAKTGKIDVGKGEDVTVRVNDPSAPGGFVNKKLAKGTDGKFYERVMGPNGQTFVEAKYTGTDVKRNDDKINFNASQLFENKRGGKMIDFVINNAAEGGTKAAFGLLTERAFGTLDYLAGTSGGLGNSNSSIDNMIIEEMKKNTSTIGGSGLGKRINIFTNEGETLTKQFNNDIEDARKNGAQRVEKQLKKAGIIAKDYRPTEEELDNYTKLALIEQRMKYIVANANKSEDRLTQKDIDNAAQRTQIIKYIASPREIRKNYESLKQEFNEKAQSYLLQFKLNGGSEQFIQTNFADIPGVQDAYKQSVSEFAVKKATKNKPTRKEILNTIKITGKVE
jgi:hypothetical protein